MEVKIFLSSTEKKLERIIHITYIKFYIDQSESTLSSIVLANTNASQDLYFA